MLTKTVSRSEMDLQRMQQLLYADQLLGKGRPGRAGRLLDRIEAGDEPVYRLLRAALAGRRYAAEGRSAAAVAAFEQVVNSGVPLPGALGMAARALLKLQRVDLAMGALGRLRLLTGKAPASLLGVDFDDDPDHPELFRLSLYSNEGRNLPRQMRYKRALTERHGLLSAAIAYRSATPAADTEVVQRPLRRLRDQAIAQALFHAEIAPRCEQDLPPPRIVGEAPGQRIRANGRSLFVACFGQARLVWRSSLIETRDALLYDWQDGEFDALPAELSCDTQCFACDSDRAWLIRSQQPELELDEAISLIGAGSHAFGHWIGELLLKLLLIDQHGYAPAAPVLIDAGMPATHREALAWLSPDRPIIEVAPWASVHVDRLWTASTPAYMPFYPAAQIEAGAEYWAFANTAALAQCLARLRRPPPRPQSPKKLFLARGASLHRRMENQQAAIELCAQRGFAEVQLEQLEFVEQLALLSGAEQIVGPAGSAMLAAMAYAQPGTRLLYLSPPEIADVAPQSTSAEARGLQLEILVGQAAGKTHALAGFSDYVVDLPMLSAVLASWADEPEPLAAINAA